MFPHTSHVESMALFERAVKADGIAISAELVISLTRQTLLSWLTCRTRGTGIPWCPPRAMVPGEQQRQPLHAAGPARDPGEDRPVTCRPAPCCAAGGQPARCSRQRIAPRRAGQGLDPLAGYSGFPAWSVAGTALATWTPCAAISTFTARRTMSPWGCRSPTDASECGTPTCAGCSTCREARHPREPRFPDESSTAPGPRRMTLGPLMLDVEGLALTAADRARLRDPLVGGVILFSRNFHDRDQIRELVGEIRSVRSPHLLVAVDQEGGRVQRFREGFYRLPPLRWLGHQYDLDNDRGRRLAQTCGWLMAAEVLDAGRGFQLRAGGGPRLRHQRSHRRPVVPPGSGDRPQSWPPLTSWACTRRA